MTAVVPYPVVVYVAEAQLPGPGVIDKTLLDIHQSIESILYPGEPGC